MDVNYLAFLWTMDCSNSHRIYHTKNYNWQLLYNMAIFIDYGRTIDHGHLYYLIKNIAFSNPELIYEKRSENEGFYMLNSFYIT